MIPVKNIEIKNFKSIRHLKIDGCKRINVFIGYPNTGKSNILEAIALFGVNEVTALKDLIRVKELPTIFFNGLIDEDIIVSINHIYSAFGNVSDNVFSLQLQISPFSENQQASKLNPILNQSLVKIFTYKNFSNTDGFQGRLEAPTDLIIKKYEFSKAITQGFGNYSSLQYPFGNNIFSVLQTNKKVKEDAKQLFDEYSLELLYDSREQRFTILKRNDSGIFTVPYELIADTLQRLVFYKAAIQSNKEKVLLFEEPEAHMFPPYVRKFTSDIIFDKTNQFFIATHSPYVLDAFMEEVPDDLGIYLVYYENGETKVKLMSDQDMDEVKKYGVDLFYNLESYLKHGQVNNA